MIKKANTMPEIMHGIERDAAKFVAMNHRRSCGFNATTLQKPLPRVSVSDSFDSERNSSYGTLQKRKLYNKSADGKPKRLDLKYLHSKLLEDARAAVRSSSDSKTEDSVRAEMGSKRGVQEKKASANKWNLLAPAPIRDFPSFSSRTSNTTFSALSKRSTRSSAVHSAIYEYERAKWMEMRNKKETPMMDNMEVVMMNNMYSMIRGGNLEDQISELQNLFKTVGISLRREEIELRFRIGGERRPISFRDFCYAVKELHPRFREKLSRRQEAKLGIGANDRRMRTSLSLLMPACLRRQRLTEFVERDPQFAAGLKMRTNRKNSKSSFVSRSKSMGNQRDSLRRDTISRFRRRRRPSKSINEDQGASINSNADRALHGKTAPLPSAVDKILQNVQRRRSSNSLSTSAPMEIHEVSTRQQRKSVTEKKRQKKKMMGNVYLNDFMKMKWNLMLQPKDEAQYQSNNIILEKVLRWLEKARDNLKRMRQNKPFTRSSSFHSHWNTVLDRIFTKYDFGKKRSASRNPEEGKSNTKPGEGSADNNLAEANTHEQDVNDEEGRQAIQ
mmetsp:Transcript_35437/g.57415  ORF Transcript_35437/g.57415 Transcript_35437/m.57415 type:complete len:558 (-) Transcript_35437:125-1798(-)